MHVARSGQWGCGDTDRVARPRRARLRSCAAGLRIAGSHTEAHLELMRERDAHYLVGTPKGRLNKLETALAPAARYDARSLGRRKWWPEVRDLYVNGDGRAPIGKERSTLCKRFKRYWARLTEVRRQRPAALLRDLADAAQCRRARCRMHRRTGQITIPEAPAKGEREKRVDFALALERAPLKKVRRREGRYPLRSNLTDTDRRSSGVPLQLSEVEAAFKDRKADLAIHPIHHQNEERVEAPIFAAFMASCDLGCALPEQG